VLVVVDFVAYLGLFIFELNRFVLPFHLVFVLRIWHRDFGGLSSWTGLGVCSGGSWVEGCLFDLCQKSGGSITFDSRSGAKFFTQVLLGFVGVSSDISIVEWWANLIVWKSKSLLAALLNSVGANGKLTVLLIFQWVFWGIFIFLFGVILEI